MADEDQDSGSKEFEATEGKRKRARDDGNIPQSKETSGLSVYVGLIIALFALNAFVGPAIFNRMTALLHHSDRFAVDTFAPGGRFLKMWMLGAFVNIVPILGILAAMVLLTLIVTRSISVSGKKIKPNIKNISPLENIKKRYGPKGFIDFLKDAAKMTFAAFLAFVFLLRFARESYASAAVDPKQIVPFTFGLVLELILIFALFQLVLALIDLPLQWRLHANRLKMTREELKKETKQSEGDPHFKQSRRDKASQISKGKMLENVKSATVLMVNPEHYAVALKWDPTSQTAPIVVAKGVDHLAARMRNLARAHDVPIYRDPPSTRSIYRLVDIDGEILPEHFAAVAAAIQFVDRLRSQG